MGKVEKGFIGKSRETHTNQHWIDTAVIVSLLETYYIVANYACLYARSYHQYGFLHRQRTRHPS